MSRLIAQMNQISIQYQQTPYGELVLGEFEGRLCLCDWRYRKLRAGIDERLKKNLRTGFVEQDNELLDLTRRQLGEYFARRRERFDLPLLPVGTDFQKRVWDELPKVPYGRTATYREIAERMGAARAVRAVASANGANALSIIIPCHRIIGSNGELVGYAGGLQAKKKLLQLEKNLFTL